jgi:hypothetical protein
VDDGLKSFNNIETQNIDPKITVFGAVVFEALPRMTALKHKKPTDAFRTASLNKFNKVAPRVLSSTESKWTVKSKWE